MKISILKLFFMLFSIFIFFLQGNDQDLLKNRQAFAGDLMDQDYFTANQIPEAKEQLHVNELYHLNKRVMDDFSAQRYNTVIGDLKYVLNRFPNHPKALMLMGSVAALKKDPSLGVLYYEKALRLYPQYALTHAQFGAYLVNIGQIDWGIAKLKKAIQIDPNLPITYVWLSEAYNKLGNLELARQAAEKARELGLKTGK